VSATQIGKATILRKFCDFLAFNSGHNLALRNELYAMKEQCDAITHARDFPGRRFRDAAGHVAHNPWHIRYDRGDGEEQWLGRLHGSRRDVHADRRYYDFDNAVRDALVDIETRFREILNAPVAFLDPPGYITLRRGLITSLDADPQLSVAIDDDVLNTRITGLEAEVIRLRNERETAINDKNTAEQERDAAREQLAEAQRLGRNATRKLTQSRTALSWFLGTETATELDAGTLADLPGYTYMANSMVSLREGLKEMKLKDALGEFTALLEEARKLKDISAPEDEFMQRITQLANERRAMYEERDRQTDEYKNAQAAYSAAEESYHDAIASAAGGSYHDASAVSPRETTTLGKRPREEDVIQHKINVLRASIREATAEIMLLQQQMAVERSVASGDGAAGGSGAAGSVASGDTRP
jgi:hypothetical protein